MIKREYIELVQQHLSGGDTPADLRGKYHEEIVSRYVGMAYDTYLWELVQTSRGTRDFSPLDVYTKDFHIVKADIKTDSIRKQEYIELPVPLPQLPGNQAIRYVGPSEVGSRGWLYRNPSAGDVMRELDVELVDQTPRYSPQNGKIYFDLLHENQKPDTILLKMIPDYEGFEDTDDLPMPGGQDFTLFPAIVQLMMSVNAEELGVDNVINADSLKKPS